MKPNFEVNPDTLKWLLQEENPSVRYTTLVDVLDRPPDDKDVVEAKAMIMQRGLVVQMLAKMQSKAFTERLDRYYTDKYSGLVWSMITLAELGATANEQILQYCEYLLDHAQELEDGGFSMHESKKFGGGRKSEVIPCLTANLVWVLIRFGYIQDPRLKRALQWLSAFMKFNDGLLLEPQQPPYDKDESCWGSHTCMMAVVKTLKALSAIGASSLDADAQQLLHKAKEFMLIHHLYLRSHALGKSIKNLWLHFGFPLMYQTDALEILDIMTSIGVSDPRMEKAVQLVESKADEQGRWVLENTYASERLLLPFGRKGEPDTWITVRALRSLKRYHQACN